MTMILRYVLALGCTAIICNSSILLAPAAAASMSLAATR